jgi:hypothetical protein
MAAGFGEVTEGKESVVAGASNDPHCLVLPFRFPMLRTAA